jgi:alpha-beta hydrolase superfamily lysophospholipase
MRRTVLIAGCLAALALSWWALADAVPNLSERFYLLFTPAALGLMAAAGPRGRAAALTNLRGLAFGFAGLFLGSIFLGLFLGFMMGVPPALPGAEPALYAWSLTALFFLIMLGYGSLEWALRAAAVPRAASRPAAMVAALLAALPLVMAFFYVHRFKAPNLDSPEEATGRTVEHVSFVTDDGLTLRGWFFPAGPGCDRTLLICHGLGANRSAFLPYVKVGEEIGANVLMFDFRAHGDSDGRTSTLSLKEKLDVLAAVRYLRTERPAQARQVFGLGVSMGSASLARAAAEVEPPLDAVILDSGFAAVTDLTDSVLDYLPPALRPFLTGPGVPLANLHAGCDLNEARPEESVGQLRAPVLILHAEEDPLIPADHARRLYARAREPRALWVAPTRGHGSVLPRAYPEYVARVRELVDGAGREKQVARAGQ